MEVFVYAVDISKLLNTIYNKLDRQKYVPGEKGKLTWLLHLNTTWRGDWSMFKHAERYLNIYNGRRSIT